MLSVADNVFYMMVMVIILLVVASITCYTIQVKSPDKNYTELHQRIRSWWVMIGILFAVLLSGNTLSMVFFAFLSFLALKEFLSIVPMRLTDRRVIFWAYLSIPFQYYWVAIGWYGMFIIFIPVYVFLFLPMRMVLIGDMKGFIRSAGIVHWGTMLTVYSISHIAYLLVLPEKNNQAGIIGPVLFLLFMTEFNDVCQYVWGKILGKHKIIPKVSPNKTWEGFIGGVVTITFCSGFIAPMLTPLTFNQGLMAGMLMSVSGFIGDVVISSVKRDLHIKDSGHLIPGHGGILDRLDSLTYTAPLFFHYLYYVSY
ncbi:phosphatidate cytidylyltransferase [Shewanella sp. VB17]|uniref:phosphatidate cytidylyltransferase n=1 Tax=Shewanella sp. VB17 TaxID=2739432 RepID=UPI0015635282|nr:phosphatidate cytidylyltransferase [Shewanella sp. VB17]NRD73651.1 phosphatidate cytidylyltransferase [Shewanella sp. VB17]